MTVNAAKQRHDHAPQLRGTVERPKPATPHRMQCKHIVSRTRRSLALEHCALNNKIDYNCPLKSGRMVDVVVRLHFTQRGTTASNAIWVDGARWWHSIVWLACGVNIRPDYLSMVNMRLGSTCVRCEWFFFLLPTTLWNGNGQ